MLMKTVLNFVLLPTLFNIFQITVHYCYLIQALQKYCSILCYCRLKLFAVYIANTVCLFYSVCICRFASKGLEETYVLVGTASDMVLNPRSFSGGSIHTFRLVTMPDDSGQKLELIHTVSVVLQACISASRLPESCICSRQSKHCLGNVVRYSSPSTKLLNFIC